MSLSMQFCTNKVVSTLTVPAITEYNGTNVVGIIPGSTLETVVYTGHIDHLGDKNGTIYPGCLDNGSGASMVLTTAYALSRNTYLQFFFSIYASRETLNRTFVFLFTTAEESGLLGSQYYISYPPSTLATATTLADINFDIGNAWGPTNDVAVLGGEKSTLGVFFEYIYLHALFAIYTVD